MVLGKRLDELVSIPALLSFVFEETRVWEGRLSLFQSCACDLGSVSKSALRPKAAMTQAAAARQMEYKAKLVHRCGH